MTTAQLTTPQKMLKFTLGAFLVFAGISHLTFARTEFLAQVPRWLPMDGDLVVVLSGIVEITLGALVLFKKTDVEKVGLVVAIFFIAIFPGNLNQYIYRIDAFGLNTDGLRLARLFMHPFIVAWPLYAMGTWRWIMDERQKRSKNQIHRSQHAN